ncbi:uncharacterized protein AB9W97_015328 [Spinachia spinachia]
MRLLLTTILILLFLWLRKSQLSDDSLCGNPCEAVTLGQAAASLLLSPVLLYSWLTSTLVQLVLSVPAAVLGSLHHSLLLLFAWPWCVATVCVSLLLTCLRVAVYLLHLALVIGAVAILTLARHKMADADVADESVLHQRRRAERRRTKSGEGIDCGRDS